MIEMIIAKAKCGKQKPKGSQKKVELEEIKNYS